MPAAISGLKWTTGGDNELIHKRTIDTGAFGDVHEVHELHVKRHVANQVVDLRQEN
jgi:hypothetical protein